MKTPNKLERLVLNITQPVKIDQDIEFSQIAVFVGANASGKSLLLKIAFALGAVGGVPVAPPGPNSSAQFVFDNTFTNQNFDGTLKAIYTNGSVNVELKEGKVVNTEITGKTVPVTFMSTDMRTFDQMNLYLRVRKSSGDDPISFMKNILEAYRLYDVTYMEALLSRMPIAIPDRIKDSMKTFNFEEIIESIEVNTELCQFIAVLDNGNRKNIATYGKGHQAMLNMMIGSFNGG